MRVHLIRHNTEPSRRGIVVGLTESDVREMRECDGVLAVEGVPDLGGRHEIYVCVCRDDQALAAFLDGIGKDVVNDVAKDAN